MPIFDPLFLCVQKARFNQRKTWFLCAQNPICLGKLQRQSLTEMLQNLVVVHFQNAEVRVIVDVGQG